MDFTNYEKCLIHMKALSDSGQTKTDQPLQPTSREPYSESGLSFLLSIVLPFEILRVWNPLLLPESDIRTNRISLALT